MFVYSHCKCRFLRSGSAVYKMPAWPCMASVACLCVVYKLVLPSAPSVTLPHCAIKTCNVYAPVMATERFPPQQVPPVQQAPPPQSHHLQGQPPSYEHGADQPWNRQPQPVTSASHTAVVTAQPTVATTSSVPPPITDNSRLLALAALVLSLVTLITCSATVVFLPCTLTGSFRL